jgi:hypothetical protein
VIAFVWSRNRSDQDPRTANVETAPHAAPIVHGATIGVTIGPNAR